MAAAAYTEFFTRTQELWREAEGFIEVQQYEGAVGVFEKAQLETRVFYTNTLGVPHHAALGRCWLDLADAYNGVSLSSSTDESRQAFLDAEQCYINALDIFERCARTEPEARQQQDAAIVAAIGEGLPVDVELPVPYSTADYLTAAGNLAYCYYAEASRSEAFSRARLENLYKADAAYRKELAMAETNIQRVPPLVNIGRLCCRIAEFAAALPFLEEAYHLSLDEPDCDPPSDAIVQIYERTERLAWTLRATRAQFTIYCWWRKRQARLAIATPEVQEAQQYLNHCIEQYDVTITEVYEVRVAHRLAVAQAYVELAKAQLEAGDAAGAAVGFEKAVAIYVPYIAEEEANPQGELQDFLNASSQLSFCYVAQGAAKGKFATEKTRLWREAVQVSEKELARAETAIQKVRPTVTIGRILMSLGDFDRALVQLKRAHALAVEVQDPEVPARSVQLMYEQALQRRDTLRRARASGAIVIAARKWLRCKGRESPAVCGVSPTVSGSKRRKHSLASAMSLLSPRKTDDVEEDEFGIPMLSPRDAVRRRSSSTALLPIRVERTVSSDTATLTTNSPVASPTAYPQSQAGGQRSPSSATRPFQASVEATSPPQVPPIAIARPPRGITPLLDVAAISRPLGDTSPLKSEASWRGKRGGGASQQRPGSAGSAGSRGSRRGLPPRGATASRNLGDDSHMPMLTPRSFRKSNNNTSIYNLPGVAFADGNDGALLSPDADMFSITTPRSALTPRGKRGSRIFSDDSIPTSPTHGVRHVGSHGRPPLHSGTPTPKSLPQRLQSRPPSGGSSTSRLSPLSRPIVERPPSAAVRGGGLGSPMKSAVIQSESSSWRQGMSPVAAPADAGGRASPLSTGGADVVVPVPPVETAWGLAHDANDAAGVGAEVPRPRGDSLEAPAAAALPGRVEVDGEGPAPAVGAGPGGASPGRASADAKSGGAAEKEVETSTPPAPGSGLPDGGTALPVGGRVEPPVAVGTTGVKQGPEGSGQRASSTGEPESAKTADVPGTAAPAATCDRAAPPADGRAASDGGGGGGSPVRKDDDKADGAGVQSHEPQGGSDAAAPAEVVDDAGAPAGGRVVSGGGGHGGAAASPGVGAPSKTGVEDAAPGDAQQDTGRAAVTPRGDPSTGTPEDVMAADGKIAPKDERDGATPPAAVSDDGAAGASPEVDTTTNADAGQERRDAGRASDTPPDGAAEGPQMASAADTHAASAVKAEGDSVAPRGGRDDPNTQDGAAPPAGGRAVSGDGGGAADASLGVGAAATADPEQERGAEELPGVPAGSTGGAGALGGTAAPTDGRGDPEVHGSAAPRAGGDAGSSGGAEPAAPAGGSAEDATVPPASSGSAGPPDEPASERRNSGAAGPGEATAPPAPLVRDSPRGDTSGRAVGSRDGWDAAGGVNTPADDDKAETDGGSADQLVPTPPQERPTPYVQGTAAAPDAQCSEKVPPSESDAAAPPPGSSKHDCAAPQRDTQEAGTDSPAVAGAGVASPKNDAVAAEARPPHARGGGDAEQRDARPIADAHVGGGDTSDVGVEEGGRQGARKAHVDDGSAAGVPEDAPAHTTEPAGGGSGKVAEAASPGIPSGDNAARVPSTSTAASPARTEDAPLPPSSGGAHPAAAGAAPAGQGNDRSADAPRGQTVPKLPLGAGRADVASPPHDASGGAHGAAAAAPHSAVRATTPSRRVSPASRGRPQEPWAAFDATGGNGSEQQPPLVDPPADAAERTDTRASTPSRRASPAGSAAWPYPRGRESLAATRVETPRQGYQSEAGTPRSRPSAASMHLGVADGREDPAFERRSSGRRSRGSDAFAASGVSTTTLVNVRGEHAGWAVAVLCGAVGGDLARRRVEAARKVAEEVARRREEIQRVAAIQELERRRLAASRNAPAAAGVLAIAVASTEILFQRQLLADAEAARRADEEFAARTERTLVQTRLHLSAASTTAGVLMMAAAALHDRLTVRAVSSTASVAALAVAAAGAQDAYAVWLLDKHVAADTAAAVVAALTSTAWGVRVAQAQRKVALTVAPAAAVASVAVAAFTTAHARARHDMAVAAATAMACVALTCPVDERARWHPAAVKIQTAYRRHAARQQAERMRGERYTRARLQSTAAREEERMRAAVQIQTLWRGGRARQQRPFVAVAKDEENGRNQMETEQHRGWYAITKAEKEARARAEAERDDRVERETAAVRIQTARRAAVGRREGRHRREYADLLRREANQRNALHAPQEERERRFIVGAEKREHDALVEYLRARKAATRIQALQRGGAARVRVAMIRVTNIVTGELQGRSAILREEESSWRSGLDSQKAVFMRMLVVRAKATLRIQAYCRGSVARLFARRRRHELQRANLHESEEDRRLDIQEKEAKAFGRFMLDVRVPPEVAKNTVRGLMDGLRGERKRQRDLQDRLRREAIERAKAAEEARKREERIQAERKAEAEAHWAATTFQKIHRGGIGRRLAAARRQERKEARAAARIQALHRGGVCRGETRRLRQITAIQALCRGVAVRAKAVSQIEESRAATKIQAICRGQSGRKVAQERRATIKIEEDAAKRATATAAAEARRASRRSRQASIAETYMDVATTHEGMSEPGDVMLRSFVGAVAAQVGGADDSSMLDGMLRMESASPNASMAISTNSRPPSSGVAFPGLEAQLAARVPSPSYRGKRSLTPSRAVRHGSHSPPRSLTTPSAFKHTQSLSVSNASSPRSMFLNLNALECESETSSTFPTPRPTLLGGPEEVTSRDSLKLLPDAIVHSIPVLGQGDEGDATDGSPRKVSPRPAPRSTYMQAEGVVSALPTPRPDVEGGDGDAGANGQDRSNGEPRLLRKISFFCEDADGTPGYADGETPPPAEGEAPLAPAMPADIDDVETFAADPHGSFRVRRSMSSVLGVAGSTTQRRQSASVSPFRRRQSSVDAQQVPQRRGTVGSTTRRRSSLGVVRDGDGAGEIEVSPFGFAKRTSSMKSVSKRLSKRVSQANVRAEARVSMAGTVDFGDRGGVAAGSARRKSSVMSLRKVSLVGVAAVSFRLQKDQEAAAAAQRALEEEHKQSRRRGVGYLKTSKKDTLRRKAKKNLLETRIARSKHPRSFFEDKAARAIQATWQGHRARRQRRAMEARMHEANAERLAAELDGLASGELVAEFPERASAGEEGQDTADNAPPPPPPPPPSEPASTAAEGGTGARDFSQRTVGADGDADAPARDNSDDSYVLLVRSADGSKSCLRTPSPKQQSILLPARIASDELLGELEGHPEWRAMEDRYREEMAGRERESGSLNAALLRRRTLMLKKKRYESEKLAHCPPGWDTELRWRERDVELAECEFEEEAAMEALEAARRSARRPLAIVEGLASCLAELDDVDEVVAASELRLEHSDTSVRRLRAEMREFAAQYGHAGARGGSAEDETSPFAQPNKLRKIDSRVRFNLPSSRANSYAPPPAVADVQFFTSILGDELLTRGGIKAASDVLAGRRYIALFFGAAWCTESRRVTPELVQLYNRRRGEKGLEVVYISDDVDQSAMRGCYDAEMPWAAVAYNQTTTRTRLIATYGQCGIPTLCVLDAHGDVVQQGPAGRVVQTLAVGGPEAWRAPSIHACVPETLVRGDGARVAAAEALRGKTIGVYVGGSAAPDTLREFNAQLAEFYAQEPLGEAPSGLEVVYVPADGDEGTALPPGLHATCLRVVPSDTAAVKRVRARAGVFTTPETERADAVPRFTVFGRDGQLLTRDGCYRIRCGAASVARNGWTPDLAGDLANGNSAAGRPLPSTLSVIVRCEECSAGTQHHAAATLTTLARAAVVAGGGVPDTLYFTSTVRSALADRLQALTVPAGSARCAMPGTVPLVLAVDAGRGVFYESGTAEVTEEGVRGFVADIRAGCARALQLAGAWMSDASAAVAVEGPSVEDIRAMLGTDAASGGHAAASDAHAPGHVPVVGNLAEDASVCGVGFENALAVVLRCEGCPARVEQASVAAVAPLAWAAAADVDTAARATERTTPHDTIFFTSATRSARSDRLVELTKAAGSARCAEKEPNAPLLLAVDTANGVFYEGASVTEVTTDGVRGFVEDLRAGRVPPLELAQGGSALHGEGSGGQMLQNPRKHPLFTGDLSRGPHAAGRPLPSTLSVIVRCEECSAGTQHHAAATLTTLARAAVVAGGGVPDTLYFTSTVRSALADRLQALTVPAGSARCAMPGTVPLVLAVDAGRGVFYESGTAEVTEEGVRGFVADIRAGCARALRLGGGGEHPASAHATGPTASDGTDVKGTSPTHAAGGARGGEEAASDGAAVGVEEDAYATALARLVWEETRRARLCLALKAAREALAKDKREREAAAGGMGKEGDGTPQHQHRMRDVRKMENTIDFADDQIEEIMADMRGAAAPGVSVTASAKRVRREAEERAAAEAAAEAARTPSPALSAANLAGAQGVSDAAAQLASQKETASPYSPQPHAGYREGVTSQFETTEGGGQPTAAAADAREAHADADADGRVLIAPTASEENADPASPSSSAGAFTPKKRVGLPHAPPNETPEQRTERRKSEVAIAKERLERYSRDQALHMRVQADSDIRAYREARKQELAAKKAAIMKAEQERAALLALKKSPAEGLSGSRSTRLSPLRPASRGQRVVAAAEESWSPAPRPESRAGYMPPIAGVTLSPLCESMNAIASPPKRAVLPEQVRSSRPSGGGGVVKLTDRPRAAGVRNVVSLAATPPEEPDLLRGGDNGDGGGDDPHGTRRRLVIENLTFFTELKGGIGRGGK